MTVSVPHAALTRQLLTPLFPTWTHYLPTEMTVPRGALVQAERVELLEAEVEREGSLAGELGVGQLVVGGPARWLALGHGAAAGLAEDTRVFRDHLVLRVSHFQDLRRERERVCHTDRPQLRGVRSHLNSNTIQLSPGNGNAHSL